MRVHQFQKKFGTDPLIETAENIADEFNISREDQDKFAHNSQLKAAEAQNNGKLANEIIPVSVKQKKGEPVIVDKDEHLRLSSLEKLASLKPVTRQDGTVTAGNASGINDGAAAIIVASEAAVKKYQSAHTPRIPPVMQNKSLPSSHRLSPHQ